MNFSLQAPGGVATPPQPPSPDLPPLQRPTRRKASGRRVLLLFVLVAVVAGAVVLLGVPGTSKSVRKLFASADKDVIIRKVTKGKLPVVVKERGNLESSENLDVFCEVEGQTTIIMIVPEGSAVKKGDLVCELDSATLKDNLVNQKITTQQAESSHRNAQLTLEVAKIAVIEYKEGTYKQNVETAKGEIALAESELKRAEDRLDWTRRMYDKTYVSLAQLKSEELALQKAKFTSEQSQTKLNVLEKYTKEKEVKELESEVAKADADERAKMATLSLERQKEEKLIKQIEKCKLFAPADGLVVYANDPNRFGGQQQPQIEEGATVRERQKIFSLPDISHMQVNTKVHESMVDRISKGLRARIRVDAFPSEVLTGTVQKVAPLPDPSSFFSSDIKVYTTLVNIDKGLPQLRPGMTAQVEILVTELDDVLTVPVQAVLQFKGKDHVYIQTPNGPQSKQVALGMSNDQYLEVKDGLQPGDQVIMNPTFLMTEAEKQEAFGISGAGDGKAKDWGKGGPAAGGPPGAAKGKGKGKGKGGFNPAMIEKFKNASPEEKQKMIEQFKAANPGGGAGFGGGPPGGGGFGGGAPGGGNGPRGGGPGQ